MSKPIGPICNLDCTYCYYLHKEELYPGTTSWRMSGPTLEEFIRQLIEAQPPRTPEITFAWQGGEPTLLGVDFFRRAVAIQREVVAPGVRIVNTLQTNGTLLNEEWVRFFRQEKFLVGLSIDGPEDLHDHYRIDKRGRGSFRDVLRGLTLLKRGGVEFNALVVVNRHNAAHGKRVYRYLRDNGVRFLQFIPIVEPRGVGAHPEAALVQLGEEPGARPGAHDRCSSAADEGCNGASTSLPIESLVSTRSVLPEQFGRFLIDVFDEWVQRDVGRVFVQIIDEALAAWMGHEPSLCVFRRQCGRALAVEHNGDVYSCDHFVSPEYLLGNLHDEPLKQLANSERQREFAAAKEVTLPQYCRACEVRFVCNGECPKNRFRTTPDGETGLNYLCEGYRQFFNHIAPVMQMMCEELQAQRPAANVMNRLKSDRREKEPDPRRPRPAASRRDRQFGGAMGREQRVRRRVQEPLTPNSPCPCGSGRKYKRCCG